MTFRLKTALSWAVLLAFVLLPGEGRTAYDYVDITNPFLRKIPIAVPVFKRLSEGEIVDKLVGEASQLLADTLEFTGYFKMLDHGAFLVDPQKAGITAPDIQFRNWTGIGAELLITGGVLMTDGLIEVELRLYDTFKERLLVGKRYKGYLDDQRRIIRRFCSDVIFQLTGSRGVFESRLAFVSTGPGNKEIFVSEFDGTNPRQFTHTKNITLSPAWSAEGKWLAYTAYAKGKPDLYLQAPEGPPTMLVDKQGINTTPAWKPGDSTQLAATLSFEGDPEIYLLTRGGKIIKRLTHSPDIDVSPTWSPDGKKIAFVSRRSGSPQIYIMDLDSGQERRLTFEGRYNTQPSWSPKGDKIAFSGLAGGRFNIFVIGINGQNLTQLTHGEGENESPAWSPDGSLMVFSSTREGPSRIYVMNAYGTDQRRLLTMPGAQTTPRWSPALSSE